MIRYALRCSKSHDFESWFKSAEAFDTLLSAGMVQCPECSDKAIVKALMSPNVSTSRTQERKTEAPKKPLSDPGSEIEATLRRLRREIEEKSEYVGLSFATEARAMHEGDAPFRAIYGEAKLEDAKGLIEDGVPVAPLPFIPNRKTN